MGIRLTPLTKPAKKGGKTARLRTALVPAAARAATQLSGDELSLSGDAIETFTKAVGGRAKLLETLAIADADNGSDKVVNCLLDDRYAAWSLRRICAYAGITVADLFASYKRALFAQAHIEAAHQITRKLAPIVEDVMARALPVAITCPRCGGRPPDLPELPPCLTCQGTGQVLSEPDLDRQKLALELGRLTAQRGGIMVQQNAIAAGAAALQSTTPGNLEQLQQVVGDLLFAPGRRRAASPQPPAIDVTPTGDSRPEAEG
jgi:hypothetical protein